MPNHSMPVIAATSGLLLASVGAVALGRRNRRDDQEEYVDIEVTEP
ncbi:hypothetical protein ZOD2009_19068 [Haladaptatus paucihalophilus DX253]|uniref:Uncharacterized protein n=1 Tax=Haladaptatus paucihalophilus DX253 TaxID=797209 RepID=E7QYC3_HALPU|nr:hypothetical protein [Haladaptatus paucihalophilus]EFW90448.1 hypothetical protein ZOD2009_19068 [Haladaptatus paucihalophilus DX253]SHL68424.1 hypothetical protein SAMN05444342_4405 [Haladaptatus paucihalophilus DX253]